MAIKKLDLHPIARDSKAIDAALIGTLEQAKQNKIALVELIPGKGTGQLKKRVLRFLQRKDIREMYSRYKVDPKNFGCITVYMKVKK